MPLLELSERSRCAGLNSVLRNIANGKALKVFIAKDADEKIKKQVNTALYEKNIPVEETGDLLQLGRACALPRKTAVAAILKD